MITAKIVFIILSLIIFSSLFRVRYSNQLRLIEKSILIIIFALCITLIVNPEILDRLALVLKIERGRDLLFYIYMLITTWGLIRSHIRINLLSSRLNQLTSRVAIESANLINK